MLGGWAKVALGIGIAVIGAAVVVAAAPAIIAVAAGAAVTAATIGAAVAVVAGGSAIGAGIALALSPDGCLQCQINNMIRGASAGMMAAMMMLTLPFVGPAAGAFALAGGGTLAAGAVMTATQLSIDVIGASAVTGIVSMMSSTGGGNDSGQGSTQQNARKGGPHRETSKPSNDGMDSHHTPAKDAYKGTNLDPEDGPAIRMDPKDHRLTASYGSSEEAEAYRQAQRELIQKGEFKKAIEMDINDIRSKFGTKYDDALKEMQEYANTIDPQKVQPKQ